MNKNLLKITGIMALFFATLYLFVFVVVHLLVPYHYLADNVGGYVILLILAFYSLVSAFGGFLFLRYKDLPDDELKEKKGVILLWAIIFLITSSICGVLCLVLLLFLSIGQNDKKINYIEELKELEKLKEAGLITAKEFAGKKKKILNI